MSPVPSSRLRALNDAPLAAEASFVLYWMTASRRARWNFGLDRAVELARELAKPLVVLEALRCGYPHANARHHRFVLDGMRDNAASFEGTGVTYHPYVEWAPGEGKGLFAALARHACAVVTDDSPTSFLPRMVRAAAAQAPCRMEAVDGVGLVPLTAPDRAFVRAFDYRRWIHRNLLDHLGDRPRPNALSRVELPPAGALPPEVQARWPAAPAALLEGRVDLEPIPIDQDVAPTGTKGGEKAAVRRLRAFLNDGLHRYDDDRNHPDRDGTSGLSPYLHYGHVSAHEVFTRIVDGEDWSPDQVQPASSGSNRGWWGLSASAEGFLDQLITWRELGHLTAARVPGYDTYGALPDWARATLAEHGGDPRPSTYTLEEFEHAATHDPVWNAAQRQLVESGTVHNYMRMLWGKKILHWTASPEEAFEFMLHLNDKYALDGRDPNSVSGIAWVCGRYDRPWGPEREVFGKIRYMTSDSARRKLKLDAYLERWGDRSQADLFAN